MATTERCVVCGLSDARALVTTRLTRGELVAVCGTHELMHRRAEGQASSVRELKAMLRDRRDTSRRMPIPDELGARLIDAFSAPQERRAATDRRR
jgi:hypothetical protein